MTDEAANGAGQNMPAELTDDQKRALGFHHKRLWQASLAAKKKADAKLKLTVKKALADGISVDTIKTMIALEDDGGEAELRADIERKLQCARWMGAELGTQFDFLDMPDRRPLDEKAFEEGKIAGMNAENCSSPYQGEAEQRFIDGWHAGQAALMSALELTKAVVTADDGEAEGEGEPAEEPTPKRRGRKPKGGIGTEPASHAIQ